MKGVFQSLIILSMSLSAFPVSAEPIKGKGVPGIPYGNPETFAEFHGFVNLDYRDFEGDAPGPREGGGKTFDQTDFYFNAIAKIRKNVTVFGEVEYKHGGKVVILDRAFIDWRIRGGITLNLGKFYAPFGLEILEYQAPVRRLVSRPFMADDLLYDEWSEIGAKVSGDLPHLPLPLAYGLALVNGPAGFREEDRMNRNNNNALFFIGRLTVTPHDATQLGFSYARGDYDDAAMKDLHFYGLDAHFFWQGLDLRGEVVRRSGDDQTVVETAVLPGATDGSPATTSRKSTVIPADASGYYVQEAYRFFEPFDLQYIEQVIRYDVRDPDKDTDNNDDRSRWALGLNLSPYQNFVMKVEYNWVDERHGGDLNNDAFLFQAVVDF